MKYRVKEFFEDMVWDSDENDWFHAIDSKRLDEQINEFIDDTPNIHIIDIKYWVIEHKNGEDESRVLLIYNEPVLEKSNEERGNLSTYIENSEIL